MKIIETFIVYYEHEYVKMHYCRDRQMKIVFILEQWNKGNVHYTKIDDVLAQKLKLT